MTDWIAELPRPLALVLAGGASLGSVQVGQLRALLERGVKPDYLVATSVGALNGAYMARGFDEEHLDALEEIWLGIEQADVFPGIGAGSVFRTLSPWHRGHLASPTGLQKLLRTHIPERHDDLRLDLTVMAADVVTSEKVALSSGALRDNVIASAAIPLVFPPCEIDGRLLIDGGVVANVPVLPAAQQGARTLIVLDPGYPCAAAELPDSKLGYLLHLMMIMIRHQSWGVLHFLREQEETSVLYLPPPCPLEVLPHDFAHTAELIERGYDNAQNFLGGLEWRGVGVYGHPHIH